MVHIVPGPAERTLLNRPVHLRNLGRNMAARALPSTADLVVRGSRQRLDGLDPDTLKPFVDLDGLGAGEYTLSVRVDASQDAGVARITPGSIHVQISSVEP